MANPRRIDLIRYPEKFQPSGYSAVDLRAYPVIAEGWEHTRRHLTKLNGALNLRLSQGDESYNYCIAAAGSFGRMEAFEASDLDFIVLADHDLQADVVDEVTETVREVLHETGIEAPNPEGVFSQVTNYAHLIERAGAKEDTLHSLAQRMLLLMEARPIYNETVFRNALDLALRKYLGYVYDDPEKEPIYLINDLIRYFRSICVNYQFGFWHEEEKWVMRNMKLRHSRVVMYGGLLLVLLNSSMKQNKPSYIRDMLSQTPLERIASVYLDAHDGGYRRILSAYDAFLRRIRSRDLRALLQVDYESRYSLPEYCDLRVTSDAIGAEMTRFILAQRGRWSESAYEYLLF
jgi:putative nucleotidyltransferase DUF294